MEKTPFLGAENELQKIYSNLGVMVPVGDLSTGKAPGFKVYEVKYNEDGEDSAVNATIQIYCNSEGNGLYALYKTSDIKELFPNGVPTNYDLDSAINDPESQDPILGKTQYAYGAIPFRKDMYTLSMQTTDVDHAPAALPYDDYTLIMSVYTCPLECMTTTVTSQFSAIAPPNWASADEVLAGNKFIADGVELVGEIVTKDSTNLTVNERTVTVPTGYYASNASASVSSDYIIPTGSTSITTNGTNINIAQYATVDVAVPNGTETLNATTNNTYYPTSPNIGFSEVVVNVPTGPSTGGATVQSCVMETVQEGGMDIHRHTIVLDTMPADIDLENHCYGVKVFALCYNSSTTDPFSNRDIEHLANISGTELAEFDLEHNTIYDYFCGSPQDQDYQDMASASGYVVLYEDSYINPIYKWPCTITTPTNPQP